MRDGCKVRYRDNGHTWDTEMQYDGDDFIAGSPDAFNGAMEEIERAEEQDSSSG